jgi:hypothetical protein
MIDSCFPPGWRHNPSEWRGRLPGRSEERVFVRTLRRRGGRVCAGPVLPAGTPEQ